MSKTNHQRGTTSRKDSERRKTKSHVKPHVKNPQLADRALTGSVHACDRPPEGWNSRTRQRDNAATKKLVESIDEQ